MFLLCTLAIGAAAGCEQATTRAPDVRFEPTPQNIVAEMLELAQVGATVVTPFLSPEMNLQVRPKLWRERGAYVSGI
jgi:hypothetical protein